jgi:hypothetical protein
MANLSISWESFYTQTLKEQKGLACTKVFNYKYPNIPGLSRSSVFCISDLLEKKNYNCNIKMQRALTQKPASPDLPTKWAS